MLGQWGVQEGLAWGRPIVGWFVEFTFAGTYCWFVNLGWWRRF